MESFLSDFSSFKNEMNSKVLKEDEEEAIEFESKFLNKKYSINELLKNEQEELFILRELKDEQQIEGILLEEDSKKNEEKTLITIAAPEQKFQSEEDFDDSSYHCSFLLSMDFDSLDPSLALAFICVCEEDYEDLVERLNVYKNFVI